MIHLKKIKDLAESNRDVLTVFLGMLVVFLYIMFFVASDLPVHARIARDMLRNNDLFRSNFLLYFMANLFTGFTGYLTPNKIAIVFLLAAANSLKYVVVRDVFCPKLFSSIVSDAISVIIGRIYIPIVVFVCFDRLLSCRRWFLGV